MAGLPTDWDDLEMNTFDAAFFNELNKLDALVELDEYNSILMPPLDGFRLRLSQLQKADKVGGDFVGLTRNFINTLTMRSDGRYLFEEDFRVYPHQIRSFSKGRSGRKQLYVGFDACPLSDLVTRPWGVSIGLGFDFRDKRGIVTACANEYEAFYEKVYCDQELFDATFGSFGGYAEGITESGEPVTAKTVFETEPGMFQHWLFLGRRLTQDDIAASGSLEGFADECIRVFDMICDAGYYGDGKMKPYRQLGTGCTEANEHLRNGCFFDSSRVASDAVERIRKKISSPKALTGISSGFADLDHYSGGFQPGDLIVIAGRPCMGAHVLAHNIAAHVALADKLPVVILDSESGKVKTALRMISSVAKIDYHDLIGGGISHDELGPFRLAADRLKNSPIYFSEFTPLSVQELGEQLWELIKGAGGLRVAIVDCLPELNWPGERRDDDYAIKIAHISRDLKALANELNISIIVLSPVERDIEERCNKRPLLTDLPGMAAIANAADMVIFTYRDEVYNTESDEKGKAQIIIARNRNGFHGSFELKFNGWIGCFEEIPTAG